MHRRARLVAVVLAGTAVLGVANPVLAQSEMEQVSALSNQLSANQIEVVQHNIDMATKALQAKDYATARKYAQMVTRADPKRVQAWLLLGTAQQGLQDWKRARGTYTTAIRLAPDNVEAHAGLGVAMAMTNDPKAQVQVAWLAGKQQACGSCYQAGQLAKLRVDVETAISSGLKTPPSPGN